MQRFLKTCVYNKGRHNSDVEITINIQPSTKPSTLGSALRSIRRESNLSLAALSKLTGLPIATLSKVENGKRSLTYDKLLQLSKGLSVDIERLFSDQPENNAAPVMGTGRRSVTRGSDGFVIESGVYSYNYLAQELVQKRFTPVVMDLHARSLDEFEELLRHEGDELAFVLEGEVVLCTDVYEPLRLKKGESVYFDSSTAHAYLNAGEGTARILCIASTAAPPRKKSEYPTPKPSPQVSGIGSGRHLRSPGAPKSSKTHRKA